MQIAHANELKQRSVTWLEFEEVRGYTPLLGHILSLDSHFSQRTPSSSQLLNTHRRTSPLNLCKGDRECEIMDPVPTNGESAEQVAERKRITLACQVCKVRPVVPGY
jgi:hypothetical protein